MTPKRLKMTKEETLKLHTLSEMGYIIQGEFTITEVKPDVLSCDLTGDGKVNLLDFAEVSRKWMKGE